MNARHHDPFDSRVVCTGCRFLVADRRCINWRAARLSGPEVFAIRTLPQRCPGHAPPAQAPPPRTPDRFKTEAQTDHDRAENPSTELEYHDMIVSETNTGTYTPCPAGSYLARCVRLVDLGTQTTDYQGEAKTAHKVLIAFEVLDTDTRRDDGEPFVLSKRYTLSLHEKAALRKELASWRGRDFTPDELRGFDLKNVLGQACFISVVETTKGDRTYSNIASIMKPPKGMQAPAGTEPLLYWSMSDPAPDWQAFAQLHAKLVEQIEASPEFKRLTPPKRVNTSDRQQAPAAAKPEPPFVENETPFDDMADDMPF